MKILILFIFFSISLFAQHSPPGGNHPHGGNSGNNQGKGGYGTPGTGQGMPGGGLGTPGTGQGYPGGGYGTPGTGQGMPGSDFRGKRGGR